MKKPNLNIHRKGFKLGTWSFALSAVAVAAVILLNLLLGQLPASATQLDISSTGLYDISSTTTDLLAGLEQDVELVLVADESTLDDRVVTFAQKYAGLSDHLSYTFVDAVEDPNAYETYGLSSNGIAVRCAETGRETTVAAAGFDGYGDAIVLYDASTYIYYQELQELSFDGEGLLTAAVNYVTSEVTQTVYTLTGHGESELSTSLSGMLRKASLTLADESVNLLMSGSIPEDCDLLMIYCPTSDLSQDELDLLLDYLAQGGRVTLITGTTGLENFNALTQTYGLSIEDGLVGDYSRAYSYYSSQYGYFCVAPVLSSSSDITASLSADAILFYPRGMTQVDPARDTITVDPFLTTSDQGFLYIDSDHDMVTGTYVLGAAATEETDGGTARLTVLTAPSLVDETITTYYSSMSNLDIFMNAVTANFDGEVTNVSIPAVSLTVEYLSVPHTSLWAGIFVLLIPLVTLIGGLVYWLRRRKR